MTFVLLTVLGVLATSSPTAAPPTCADTLLQDWYDGAIEGTYEPECYTDAIDALPEDVRVYTSAVDDLTRAMRETIAAEDAAAEPAEGSRSLSGVGPATRQTQSREAAGALGVEMMDPLRRPPLPLLLVLGLALAVMAAATAGRLRRN